MRNTSSGFGGFIKGPVSVILMTSVFWHIVVWAAGIPFNYYVSLALFIVDLVVAYLLLDRLIYFFSQFVLPIQNPNHRQEIYTRVKNFDGSNRGPALFIKNGRVIEHEGEAEKHGPGLIVLDTASAGVLRTDTEIKETIGPGVVFTKSYKKNGEHHNEYVAGSVDLRAQWQFIGPLASEQTVLNPAPKPATDPQKSRQQTNGLTRDGFEIVPTISIKFRIKRPLENRPTESGVTTEYEFDAESVRNAITREVVQLGTADNSKVRMEWNKLPAHLVVNLWREYIRKFKLGDLFTSTGVSGLQTIEDMINKRVRQKDVVALDDTGLPTGEWQESLEFRQLESRGLEIMEVRIHNVSFESEIEKQHIEQWSAEWLNLAKKEAQQLKEKETLIETAARDEASKTFARIASMPFHVTTKQPQQNPFKTLQLLILPLKDYLLSESNANTEMEAELRKLDDVWKWLLDNNPDGTGPRIVPGDKP
jgi:hypothetical protein